MEKLTPTQQRIYDLLSDGKRHASSEVLKKCMDEGSQRDVLRVHVWSLRKKLSRMKKETVASEIVNGKLYYKLEKLEETT